MSESNLLSPHGEGVPRADAARNHALLVSTARGMISEKGVAAVTMDGLAARAGLGKGTVFRRFGSRAGIFRALLDSDEKEFQTRVLSGPPPLGPGAAPAERLLAYGEARIAHLLDHREILAAAVDSRSPSPVGPESDASRLHLRILLEACRGPGPKTDAVAIQLHAALEAPVVLYFPAERWPDRDGLEAALLQGWAALVRTLCP